MAETRLCPRDPLASVDLSMGADLQLSASPLTTRFLVQAKEDTAKKWARSLGWADAPGMLRALSQPESALLHLGPEEILWVATPYFAAKYREFLPENGIEISHGLIGLVLKGHALLPVLAAGCPLDWHEKAFPCGMATRTLFGKFEIVVWRQAPDQFHLELGRSYLSGFVEFFRECARTNR